MAKHFFFQLPDDVLFFDIETGGIDTVKSSILSLTYGKSAKDIRSVYSEPVVGSYVSDWAKAHVLAQIEREATKYTDERELIQGFTNYLTKMPAGSTLAGWNIGYMATAQKGYIPGFDIPALMQRAGQYGLAGELGAAIERHQVRDIGREFLASVAIPIHKYMSVIPEEEIAKHMDPQIWHQIRPYAAEAARLRAEGMSIPGIARQLQGWGVAGWKQEQAVELLLGRKAVGAHLSEQDVLHMMDMASAKMEKLEGEGLKTFVQSWERGTLRQRLVKAAQSAAKRGEAIPWAEIEERAGRFGGGFVQEVRGAIEAERRFFIESGATWTAQEGKALRKIGWGRVGETLGKLGWGKAVLAGVGAVAAGAWLTGAGRLFMDEDVQVERARRGQIVDLAGQTPDSEFLWGKAINAAGKSEVKTDFGSPWQGPVVSGAISDRLAKLPSSLMGQPIDPSILLMRAGVIEDKEARARMRKELRKREKESQVGMGEFTAADFVDRDIQTIEGINQKLRNLKVVQLSNFIVNVEDADTLILRRPGISSWFKSLFGHGEISIRLAGIDAPETVAHDADPLGPLRIWQDQPAGEKATRALRKIFEQNGENLSLVVSTGRKTYGRYLGAIVDEQDRNINVELARQGWVSALPFGKAEEDLVRREETAAAEAEAQAAKAGIWQYARYQALRNANEAIGRPITHNVLSRIDKLAENLNLGAYVSFLQSLGSEQRDLTWHEARRARRMGRALRKTHGDPSVRLATGRRRDHNTVEGLPHQGIGPEIRRRMTPFGSPVDMAKLLEAPLVEKILGAGSREASEAAVSQILKTAAGKEAQVEVGGVKALLLKELGSGKTGTATMAWVPGKGEAVLKSLRSSEQIALPAEILKPGMDPRAAMATLPFGSELPTALGIHKAAIGSGDMAAYLAKREASLMHEAAKEYGSLVPKVYSQEGRNILMEYAGKPMEAMVEGQIPKDAAVLKAAQKNVSAFLEHSWTKGNVVYMDPHSGNVAFKKVGDEVQVKMIDWGGAFFRHEMRSPALSPGVLKTTIARRTHVYEKGLAELPTQVVKGRQFLQELRQYEAGASQSVASNNRPYIEGFPHGGMAEGLRHELTPFGGPINWLKNLFGGNKRMVGSMLKKAAERKEVAVIPKELKGLVPKGLMEGPGSFVPRSDLKPLIESIQLEGAKRGLKAGSVEEKALNEVFQKLAAGPAEGSIFINPAYIQKAGRFNAQRAESLLRQTLAHEGEHLMLRSTGNLGKASVAFRDMTGGYGKFVKEYMQTSSFYRGQKDKWAEEYLAHARGALAVGMTKSEKRMYADALRFMTKHGLPTVGNTSNISKTLKLEMAESQRRAMQEVFQASKFGAKGHRLQKR